MPKRSNQFQRLIHSINAQLATGAVVSESKLIEHRLTGTKREVDIAIEYETPRTSASSVWNVSISPDQEM